MKTPSVNFHIVCTQINSSFHSILHELSEAPCTVAAYTEPTFFSYELSSRLMGHGLQLTSQGRIQTSQKEFREAAKQEKIKQQTRLYKHYLTVRIREEMQCVGGHKRVTKALPVDLMWSTC